MLFHFILFNILDLPLGEIAFQMEKKKALFMGDRHATRESELISYKKIDFINQNTDLNQHQANQPCKVAFQRIRWELGLGLLTPFNQTKRMVKLIAIMVVLTRCGLHQPLKQSCRQD